MKFLKLPIEEAHNCILAHNYFDESGRRILKMEEIRERNLLREAIDE